MIWKPTLGESLRLMLAVGLALGPAGCAADATAPDAAVEPDAGASPEAGVDHADGGRRDSKPVVFVEPAWVKVAAGDFGMGSPTSEACRREDEDQHQVTISRAFDLGETEVTQEQFQSLMGYNPSFQTACGVQCPVDWVSWHEAAAYCNALSAAKGLPTCYACTGSGAAVTCDPPAGSKLLDCTGFRLPTEAEFEHAARAGTTTALPNGAIASCMSSDPNADKIAWYKVNSTGLPRPVRGKAANAWGLYDLTGNAYEWVSDWYQPHLGTAPLTDPVGPTTGGQRVFRGGAWYFNAEHLRPAHRLAFAPTKRFTFLGFRCARTR